MVFSILIRDDKVLVIPLVYSHSPVFCKACQSMRTDLRSNHLSPCFYAQNFKDKDLSLALTKLIRGKGTVVNELPLTKPATNSTSKSIIIILIIIVIIIIKMKNNGLMQLYKIRYCLRYGQDMGTGKQQTNFVRQATNRANLF